MIRREDLPTCPVVAVYGDLDFSNVASFDAALSTLAAELVVIVSLEHATFIDSTVLSALLRRYREHAGAVVVVLPGHSSLGRIFDVTGLRGILGVTPDMTRAAQLAAAQRSFAGASVTGDGVVPGKSPSP